MNCWAKVSGTSFTKIRDAYAAYCPTPKNLPHRTRIRVGPEVLDLCATAMYDAKGTFIGIMQTWALATAAANMTEKFENTIKGIVDLVSAAATELQATAESLSQSSSQLSDAISEISKQVSETTLSTTRAATNKPKMQAQQQRPCQINARYRRDHRADQQCCRTNKSSCP